jgi:Fungal Zn(2)-Cys(6) binuclear cluster domain
MPPSLQPIDKAAKRLRVFRSCQYCREKKLKCDQSLPCSQCVQRSRGDSCTAYDGYSPRALRRPRPVRSAAPGPAQMPRTKDASTVPTRPAPPSDARPDVKPVAKYHGLKDTRSLLGLVCDFPSFEFRLMA